jgi:hypothetical protein
VTARFATGCSLEALTLKQVDSGCLRASNGDSILSPENAVSSLNDALFLDWFLGGINCEQYSNGQYRIYVFHLHPNKNWIIGVNRLDIPAHLVFDVRLSDIACKAYSVRTAYNLLLI